MKPKNQMEAQKLKAEISNAILFVIKIGNNEFFFYFRIEDA